MEIDNLIYQREWMLDHRILFLISTARKDDLTKMRETSCSFRYLLSKPKKKSSSIYHQHCAAEFIRIIDNTWLLNSISFTNTCEFQF